MDSISIISSSYMAVATLLADITFSSPYVTKKVKHHRAINALPDLYDSLCATTQLAFTLLQSLLKQAGQVPKKLGFTKTLSKLEVSP